MSRGSVLLCSILMCKVSKYRGFRVYSVNKTGGRKKMFITSTSAAGNKERCLAPSQHLSKLLFWDTGELS